LFILLVSKAIDCGSGVEYCKEGQVWLHLTSSLLHLELSLFLVAREWKSYKSRYDNLHISMPYKKYKHYHIY